MTPKPTTAASERLPLGRAVREYDALIEVETAARRIAAFACQLDGNRTLVALQHLDDLRNEEKCTPASASAALLREPVEMDADEFYTPLLGLRTLQRVQDPRGFVALLTREQCFEWLRLAIGYEGSSVHEIALLILDAMERAL